jgi:hypothetical protein
MMPRSKTLREKIEQRIVRKKGEDVFLTREFRKLGGEDQVLRALRSLVDEGRLVRLGYGVYGRAIVSRLSGKPMLYSPLNGSRPKPSAPTTRAARRRCRSTRWCG